MEWWSASSVYHKSLNILYNTVVIQNNIYVETQQYNDQLMRFVLLNEIWLYGDNFLI